MVKPFWKKTIIIVLDVVLAVYLILAFAAFNKPDETAYVCTKVNIDIADATADGFIDGVEIKKRLESARMYPIGKPMKQVNARKIEEQLKKSPFVKTAECYKTQDGHVNISITQRLPVVRVKAINGDDYYLDDQDCVMPNSHYISDLVIVTGYVNRAFSTSYISPFGRAVMGNKMWRNLIEQINVLPDQGIEIVPRVGDHVVYLGHLPEVAGSRKERTSQIVQFVENKMSRLEKFYRYGLSQAGWNKYSYINLEFDNQIICKKRSQKLSRTVLVRPAEPVGVETAGKPEVKAGQPEVKKKKGNN